MRRGPPYIANIAKMSVDYQNLKLRLPKHIDRNIGDRIGELFS